MRTARRRPLPAQGRGRRFRELATVPLREAAGMVEAVAARDSRDARVRSGTSECPLDTCLAAGELVVWGSDAEEGKAGRCVDKYTQTWPKLVAKFAGKGTFCEASRCVNNDDDTFYDGPTRLTWEEETEDG